MKKFSIKTKFALPTFLQDIGKTFVAIQWPSLKEIAVSLLAVFIFSAIIGAYLWLLDTGFGQLRNVILFN